MANGKVASYSLELRMAVADGIVNGRDFADIRGYLLEAGLPEADLPSDHSLRTYAESVEYDMIYRRRMEAIELRQEAGAMAGMAAARVEIIQNRALETLDRWMEAGLVESADIFRALAFTLQFQRQVLAGRKLRSDMGERELPEPLAPRQLSKADLDEFLARKAAELTAANAKAAAEAAAAEAEEAAELEATRQDGRMLAKADDGGSARMMEDDGGSARKVEDDGGFGRKTEDREGVRVATDEPEREREPAAVAGAGARTVDRGGFTRKVEDRAGFGRMMENTADDRLPAEEPEVMLAATGTDGPSGGWSSHTSFRNSPSPAARAKARSKRKKRRK